ncbi:MAG: three-Cys-motif partner protein TcmP [Cytophagales bacterium]|nr:three-Cys-motif partner protein TcmP [Cytophagales bacterium]
MAAISETELADDGMIAEVVGAWAKNKHEHLCRYIDISRAARKGFVHSFRSKTPHGTTAGAAYIDLFCGSGRSVIRGTNEWIDGGAVAAWKMSVKGLAPFSEIFISDTNEQKLRACEIRLKALGAKVTAFVLPAVDAAKEIALELNQHSLHKHGLHFAFIDPFGLEGLDFRIIESLAVLKRIDLLIHLSAMDLQRNLTINIEAEESAFDKFAPGWRDSVNCVGTQYLIRQRVVEFWRQKITALQMWPSTEHKLITGQKSQPLYWLLLAAKHPLAHSLWETASNPEGQGALFG